MRVRFTSAHRVYWNHMVHAFASGEELPGGELANYLLAGGAPVEEIELAPAEEIEAAPAEDEQDPDDDEAPVLDVPDGSIAQVLLWVGDDCERAATALAAERGKGNGARVGLVAALEKQLAAA